MERKLVFSFIFIIIFINFIFIFQAYFVYARFGGPLAVDVFFTSGGTERFSPSDWIKNENIYVAPERVTVELNSSVLTYFANTNSMDPVLDEFSNGLEIKPKKPEDIHIGDIVAYFSYYNRQFIVHRIVKTGYDGEGWYAIARGDNQLYNDPGKIRWEQIEGVTVVLLY